jgi:polar amino acid transport system substrate-binding protein
MKLKSLICTALAVIVSAGMLAGCGSTQDQSKAKAADTAKKPLRVATNATFVPFEFKDEKTGDYAGYEMDLVRAVAKTMGREVQMQDMAFNGLIPLLQSGDVDMAAAGMAITKERTEKVLFASPFYETRLVVLVKKDSGIQSKEDLANHRLAVQMGTIAADYVQTAGLQAKQFDHNADALMDLQVGGSDAVIAAKPVLDYFAASNDKGNFKVIPLMDTPKQYVAFAMNKKNTELQKEVNAAIAKLKETGEFQQLYKKWFGHEPDTLPVTTEEALQVK